MDIVDFLVRNGYLRTPRIIQAFRRIKREDFVSSSLKDLAQVNKPLPIGFEQTISQPLTVAFMLELLQPQERDKVLDVGAGSGWVSALLSEIVGPGGKVFAVERIPELKNFGENNLRKYDFIESGRVKFILGDGSKGLPEESPFNCIHVGAAAEEIPPELKKQLAIGGRMVIPVKQDIVFLKKKKEDKFEEKNFSGFVFVPLITH
ncbi:protein-L-isoaspartate O-methyltransferase [bacterium]|nr:protein-L-isoaspartate O-methyltransferase [bacterium]